MGHRDLSWMVTSLATRYESGVLDKSRVDTTYKNFLTGITLGMRPLGETFLKRRHHTEQKLTTNFYSACET